MGFKELDLEKKLIGLIRFKLVLKYNFSRRLVLLGQRRGANSYTLSLLLVVFWMNVDSKSKALLIKGKRLCSLIIISNLMISN